LGEEEWLAWREGEIWTEVVGLDRDGLVEDRTSEVGGKTEADAMPAVTREAVQVTRDAQEEKRREGDGQWGGGNERKGGKESWVLLGVEGADRARRANHRPHSRAARPQTLKA
jgi:hypothetical protein